MSQSNAAYAVRYLRSNQQLYIQGEDGADWTAGWGLGRLSSGFLIPLELARPITLTSLRRALAEAVADDASGGGLHGWVDLPRDASLVIADTPVDRFDSKYSPQLPVLLDLVAGKLIVCVNVEFDRDDWDERAVESTLRPMLTRLNTKIVDCAGSEDGAFAGNPWPWAVRLEMPIRGRTVAEAIDMGDAVRRLLTIADHGQLDAATSWDLVTSGQSAALLGQPESAWLEVKSMGWDLTTDAGKIELAQDIARFANGEVHGLMVVGLGTKKIDGAEVIHLGPRQTFTAGAAQRHHQVIDQRVYPPVEGLRVEPVLDDRGGQLLAFWIPAQPAELKPFLVHGVMVGAKVEGAFFSVVRRRGEHSIPVTAQALHAQIAAGRALLQRGYELVRTEPRDVDD